MKKLKFAFFTFFILILTSSGVLARGSSNIYRLYNSVSGEHLYTSSQNESQILSSSHGWTDEGIGWVAPENGDEVFRLFNPQLNDHLYTTDKNEVNVLASQHGWQIDNNGASLFYSGGPVPVYRLYDEKTGRHHLTTDGNEYNVLATQGWRQEGVSLSALEVGKPNQQPTPSLQNGKTILRLQMGTFVEGFKDFSFIDTTYHLKEAGIDENGYFTYPLIMENLKPNSNGEIILDQKLGKGGYYLIADWEKYPYEGGFSITEEQANQSELVIPVTIGPAGKGG